MQKTWVEKGRKQTAEDSERRRVHNFKVDDVFTAFYLQIFSSLLLLCFFESLSLQINAKGGEELLVVELFIIQMNQFLSAHQCCFVFFFRLVSLKSSKFYGIFSCINEL